MKNIHDEIEITQEQAEAMACGLFAVARADGSIHPAEESLIADFFSSTTDDIALLGHLSRCANIDGASLAARLPSKSLRELFLKTAIMVAYADGKYAETEKRQIQAFAEALEINGTQLKDLQTEVKEYLISNLSHLKNVEAVANVLKELEL